MKVQSVRFGTGQWDLICAAAEAEGISAAQFIRDAAYARAVLHQRESGALVWVALADVLQKNPELRQVLESLLGTEPPDEPGAQP
jgi:hypothetical protein